MKNRLRWQTMRERLLVGLFLWRFLEHDLVSPISDRRGVLSAVFGLVIALSLFAAVLLAWPYQLFPAMPPGIAALSSLDDRFLLVAMSMVIMALAAAGQWDALVLDARDAAVLGTLPLPHRMIVRSKFAATGFFALGVLTAWNLIPTLLRGAAVPAGLRLGWLATLQLTLAHGVSTGAAGWFGFLAVLGSRETVCALLGPARFRRVSTMLQAAVIMVLITALLLLLRPGSSAQIGQRYFASRDAVVRMLPPLWFVGLDEVLAGSVIDSVPRTRIRPYLVQEDEVATTLYRSLRPAFPTFGGVGLAALFSVSVFAVGACLWNSRQLPSGSSRSQTTRGIAGRTFDRLATSLAARSALQRAGFSFALQTISRRGSHGMTMAAAIAVALSLIIAAGFSPAPDTVASISIGFLATQSLVVGVVITGFRHVSRVPAELRSGMTFGVAWQGAPMPFVSGVKRAGWLAVVLPALALMSMWHIEALGRRLMLVHLGVGVAVGIVMMDAVFFQNRRVPLASVYIPSPDAKATGVLYCAGLLTASFAVAIVERASFAAPGLYAGLLVALLTISACLRWFDGVSPTATIELDVDEQASLPTQLNLSR